MSDKLLACRCATTRQTKVYRTFSAKLKDARFLDLSRLANTSLTGRPGKRRKPLSHRTGIGLLSSRKFPVNASTVGTKLRIKFQLAKFAVVYFDGEAEL